MPCPITFYGFIIIIICVPIQFVADAYDFDKQHFRDCAPFKCGDISGISYPFRHLGGSDYCGHPGFEVECVPFDRGNYLIMTMGSVIYKVNSIAWEKRRLNITRADLYFGLCPEFKHFDTILDHSLFDYAPGSENATLYYDCEEAWIKDPYRFSCDMNATRYGYLFFYKPESHQRQLQLSKNCSHNITVRLFERPHPQPSSPESVRRNILATVFKGFEITWKVDMRQCRSCNFSGGRCGNNNTTKEFNCFCPEGVHPKECTRKMDMQQCGSCNISGGKCGHDNTTEESKCFCPEGVHPKECPQLGSKVPQKISIGVGVGVGGLILVVIAFFYSYQRQNQRKYAPKSCMSRSFSSNHSSRIDYEKDGCYGLPIFDYEELKEATDNFDQKNKVGNGGFGTVYKGKLRDGRIVAIKRLYENDYKIKEQFLNEVEMLARLRHPNLVILYGFTSPYSKRLLLVYEFISNGTVADHLYGDQAPYSKRLLLVYEFISNGTVADHLYGDQAQPGSLSWSTRLKIAINTATALLYLHHSDVIHRDVKTNNILLNDNFSVKVADFGLSRLFPFNVSHVVTAPQGTPGYVDPEYYQCYQLTGKSDVYSFGVVLMELISSLPAVDLTRHKQEIHLSTMAINKIQNGALHELVDKHLGFDCNDNIRRMILAVAELAFCCLQHAREMRPCMEEVLETLRSIEKLDKPTNEATEMGSLLNDAVLLKSEPICSPHSVMVKLDSTSTTLNASS